MDNMTANQRSCSFVCIMYVVVALGTTQASYSIFVEIVWLNQAYYSIGKY